MDTFDKLDKVDLQILRTLQENARLTTKELAARVSLSSTPVFERLKRLESGGYIKKYKFKDRYTIFSIILLYFLNIIFCFYIGEQGWLFGRFTKKEDSVRIEDLKDIMFIINKDMYGAWGTGEENMNN